MLHLLEQKLLTLSCFKQVPLKCSLILELFYNTSLGGSLLFAVIGGLIFSFENLLDFHSTIVSLKSAGIVKIL